VTTRTYSVQDGDRTVTFDGQLLAAESSYAHRRQRARLRWSELRLFAVVDGSFALAGVGRSQEPGEHDRFWLLRTTDPRDLVNKLTMHELTKTTSYIPSMSRRLLETAARHDARLVEIVASVC
jgi:hypothetical protein